MIEPPIDKLIEKSKCKYALSCVMSKRARTILDQSIDDLEFITSAEAVSRAAKEIHDGAVVLPKGNLK